MPDTFRETFARYNLIFADLFFSPLQFLKRLRFLRIGDKQPPPRHCSLSLFTVVASRVRRHILDTWICGNILLLYIFALNDILQHPNPTGYRVFLWGSHDMPFHRSYSTKYHVAFILTFTQTIDKLILSPCIPFSNEGGFPIFCCWQGYSCIVSSTCFSTNLICRHLIFPWTHRVWRLLLCLAEED